MENKKKKKSKFIAVDVWQKEFSPISVKAVYDVFSTEFNIEPHNMRKYSFSHCVNTLRKLENPEYEDPKGTMK